MSDLVGNHIVGFPTRRLISYLERTCMTRYFEYHDSNAVTPVDLLLPLHCIHYKNMPMQYIGFSEAVKIENFQ